MTIKRFTLLVCIAFSVWACKDLAANPTANKPNYQEVELNTVVANTVQAYLTETAPTATAIPCPLTSPSFEARAIELINGERVHAGLPALVAQDQLIAAARSHSADMACNDYFNHADRSGVTVDIRASASGYVWSVVGENIAAGYSTPENVVEGWMNSVEHKANILNADFTQIGIGYVFNKSSSYIYYWTAVFGKPSQ